MSEQQQPPMVQPQSPSASSDVVIPGVLYPPPPAILAVPPLSHSLPGPPGAPMISLHTLIASWCKRAHDHLHDQLESLETVTDSHQYRQSLLTLLLSLHQSLTRLLVVVEYVTQSLPLYHRIHSMNSVLYHRDHLYQTSVDMLKVLAHHLDSRALPAYDLSTATHVLTSGDYQLLPNMIERAINIKPSLAIDRVTAIKHRLDDHLHYRLLSSSLPPQYSNVRVRNGIAWLTVRNEFMVGVSLRMTPQSSPPVSDDDRIKWRLFHAHILVNTDTSITSSKDSGGGSLVNDVQLGHLIAHCNSVMHQHTQPLTLLYQTMHSFTVSLSLSLLYSQCQSLVVSYHSMLDIQYRHGRSLTIQYWKGAEMIPIEGSMTAMGRPMIAMQLIVDEDGSLSLRHSPPLPEMERSDASDSDSDRFAINFSRLSLSTIFANILTSHAHYRLQRLMHFIQRSCQSLQSQSQCYDSIALTDLSLTIVLVKPHCALLLTVDQNYGTFQFAFAHKLTHTSTSSESELQRTLKLGIDTIKSEQSLLSLIPLLKSLKSIAVINETIAILTQAAHRVVPGLPIIWTTAVTAPADNRHLVYLRCRMSPMFYLCLSLSSLPVVGMWLLHTEEAEVPSLITNATANSNTAPPAAAAANGTVISQKRVRQRTALNQAVALTKIDPADLVIESLSLPPSPSLIDLSMIDRALVYCESRIPLLLIEAQLKRLSLKPSSINAPSSLTFSCPLPPPPGDSKHLAVITITVTPYDPCVTEPMLITNNGLSRVPLGISHRNTHTSTSANNDSGSHSSGMRVGWVASIHCPPMSQLWDQCVHLRPTEPELTGAMTVIHHPLSVSLSQILSVTERRILSLQYESLSDDSVSHLLGDVVKLYLSAQLALNAIKAFTPPNVPLWRERDNNVLTKGLDPPPSFFSLVSCCADSLVIRYDLSRVPYYGSQQRDVCTITLRQRSPSELAESHSHHLHSSAQRHGNIACPLTFHPYPFPQHTYLELELNTRFDFRQFLQHVYWSCLAVKVIGNFMRKVTAIDSWLGYHRLAMHQSLVFTYPPSQSQSQLQSVQVSMVPSMHTVQCIPESSTRLRFQFRKQGRTTKVDIRLVNAFTLIQDFFPPNTATGAGAGSGAGVAASGTDSNGSGGVGGNRSLPGRIYTHTLGQFLYNWYQWCGQSEQMKRIAKFNRALLTVPMKFEKVPLDEKPIDKPLITITYNTSNESGSGINGSVSHSERETELVTKYWNTMICIPPYSGESVFSFLKLLSSPRHIINHFLPILDYELIGQSSTANTSRLSLRWCSWLNQPHEFEYDAHGDTMYFVTELIDKQRQDSVYMPLAYCVKSQRAALWEFEEMAANSDGQHTYLHSLRRIRPLVVKGIEYYDSLWSLMKTLISLPLVELIAQVSVSTPIVERSAWQAPNPERRAIKVEALKAEAMKMEQSNGVSVATAYSVGSPNEPAKTEPLPPADSAATHNSPVMLPQPFVAASSPPSFAGMNDDGTAANIPHLPPQPADSHAISTSPSGNGKPHRADIVEID